MTSSTSALRFASIFCLKNVWVGCSCWDVDDTILARKSVQGSRVLRHSLYLLPYALPGFKAKILANACVCAEKYILFLERVESFAHVSDVFIVASAQVPSSIVRYPPN